MASDRCRLVERVLIAFYPESYEPALKCAKTLAAVVLRGNVQIDWSEVKRIAKLPEYDNLPKCTQLVGEVANELGVRNPLDTHEQTH